MGIAVPNGLIVGFFKGRDLFSCAALCAVLECVVEVLTLCADMCCAVQAAAGRQQAEDATRVAVREKQQQLAAQAAAAAASDEDDDDAPYDIMADY
jgi:hypothetical protein